MAGVARRRERHLAGADIAPVGPDPGDPSGGVAQKTGELGLLVDLDAPLSQVQFLDMSDLTLYRDKPWSWLDRDGSMWKQDVAGGARDADAAAAAIILEQFLRGLS